MIDLDFYNFNIPDSIGKGKKKKILKLVIESINNKELLHINQILT